MKHEIILARYIMYACSSLKADTARSINGTGIAKYEGVGHAKGGVQLSSPILLRVSLPHSAVYYSIPHPPDDDTIYSRKRKSDALFFVTSEAELSQKVES